MEKKRGCQKRDLVSNITYLSEYLLFGQLIWFKNLLLWGIERILVVRINLSVSTLVFYIIIG